MSEGVGVGVWVNCADQSSLPRPSLAGKKRVLPSAVKLVADWEMLARTTVPAAVPSLCHNTLEDDEEELAVKNSLLPETTASEAERE